MIFIQTILPFIISIILYLVTIFVITVTTRHIANSNTLPRSFASRILLSFAVLFVLFVLFFFYFGPVYLPILSSSVWSIMLLLTILTAIILITCSLFLSRSNPLSSFRYPGHHWRNLDLPRIRYIHYLQSIEPPLSILATFFILVILPYFLRGLILLSIGDRLTPDHDLQSLLARLAIATLLCPLLEEYAFRWLALTFYGPRGLAIGSALWFFFHPVDRLIMGMTFARILPSIPVWFPQIAFYIKLWRGRHYWTAFLFHSLTNLSIILVANFFGIP